MNNICYCQDLSDPFCSQSTQAVPQVAPAEPVPVAQPQAAQPAAVASVDRYANVRFSVLGWEGGWCETLKYQTFSLTA